MRQYQNVDFATSRLMLIHKSQDGTFNQILRIKSEQVQDEYLELVNHHLSTITINAKWLIDAAITASDSSSLVIIIANVNASSLVAHKEPSIGM